MSDTTDIYIFNHYFGILFFFFTYLSYLFILYIYLTHLFIYLFSVIHLFIIFRRPLPDFTDSFAQRRRSRQQETDELERLSDYRHVQTAVFRVLIFYSIEFNSFFKQRDKIHTAITMRTKAMN